MIIFRSSAPVSRGALRVLGFVPASAVFVVDLVVSATFALDADFAFEAGLAFEVAFAACFTALVASAFALAAGLGAAAFVDAVAFDNSGSWFLEPVCQEHC